VTSAKILNGTITTDDIATDTIAAVDIAADSIGASELANNSVAAANIIDGSIVNADVNASAAIAGTKISPDFGSQNIITTGNVGIGALSPSSALQIDDASITSGNKSFRIYGYDIGASTAKYGALSVDGAGNFTVSAEDTYLLLNAANYIQSNKPHNFTSSVLFGGDTNLFRSAANTLRTNDAFIVDGNVGI